MGPNAISTKGGKIMSDMESGEAHAIVSRSTSQLRHDINRGNPRGNQQILAHLSNEMEPYLHYRGMDKTMSPQLASSNLRGFTHKNGNTS